MQKSKSKTKQKLSNKEIVQILKEVLAALEVKNASWFRIRAYQNAIAVLDNLTTSIEDIYEDDRLNEIPGIGEGLEQHIKDLFEKGVAAEFEAVKKDLPEGMFVLLGLRGVGAKKAFKLAEIFELHDRKKALKTLKKQAKRGAIGVLEGFGDKSEKNILEAIEELKMSKNDKERMLLVRAEQIVERITEYMNECKDVEKLEALGSYRRRNPTIGDIDLAVATKNSEKVIDHFVKFPEAGEVVNKGDRKAVIVLKTDVQIDLRVSKPEAYGSMIQYFTGSKQHNILLRTYAKENRMSLSEYGIKKSGEINEYEDEEAFYRDLGLPYIPPEIRHGADEVELAKDGKLPSLVKLADIKGDIQTHTVFSDGSNTMEEMVEAAASLGYEYIGISDHNPSLQSRSYKEVDKLLDKQLLKAKKLNKKQTKIRVLYGLEVNLLANGKISLPDELLQKLDFAAGAIHSAFRQDKEKTTKRIINAIENPYITYIAHPSNRLINEREACDISWTEVFAALKANDKMIEINAQPNRLDLADDLVRQAIKKEIKLLINTDAHAVDQLRNMKYGIDVARRGFAEKENIINTLPFKEFVKHLK